MAIDPSNAPLRTASRTVPSEWIDYNGHMNVAYYVMAFDQSLDEVFTALGIGEEAAAARAMGSMALQTQICYTGELHEGEAFYCELLLLDTDHKRTHLMMTMRAVADNRIAATYESLSINVDLNTRKSTPYPEEIAARISAMVEQHRDAPRPPQVGASLGIRR